MRGNDEIQWWLNKAISQIGPLMGECKRWVQIDEQRQLDYYNAGKVFQWVNFFTVTSTKKEDTPEDR